MTIQGKKIDKHILDNNMHMETQAVFTKGSQIEDNLIILQYCIEQNFKRKKLLVVTCIDYSKAILQCHKFYNYFILYYSFGM